MAHSRIIQELIGRDPERIRADLEAIKQEQAALEAEVVLLNQVLAIQALRNGTHSSAPVVPDGPWKTPARREGQSISAAVLDVMRAEAGAWLGYDDVYARLRTAGIQASRNAMRVALGRWAERGELEQNDRSEFRAPAPQAQQGTLGGGNS